MLPAPPYNAESRLRKQAELRARIAEAAARCTRARAPGDELRGHRGEAKVSLPTVYAHYPRSTRCSTAARATSPRAPALPVDGFLAAQTLRDAAEQLVDAMEQQHLHLRAWLSWREDRAIPSWPTSPARVREIVGRLDRRVIAQHLRARRAPRTVVRLGDRLSFDAWHRLARGTAFRAGRAAHDPSMA
jgi:hypothetical protein